MPRKQIGPGIRTGEVSKELAEQLAVELKSNRDRGQPMIYEQTFRTGKVRVTVLWDAWHGIPLQERSATILRAYELAEGRESQERIALASGLTVPEAYAAGMLPYHIIAALRKGDSITVAQAQQALLDEGGSQLFNPRTVQLRFATEEEAEAARRRLIERFSGSDEVWMIEREMSADDFAKAQDGAQVQEG
jgi:hypothetical protein